MADLKPTPSPAPTPAPPPIPPSERPDAGPEYQPVSPLAVAAMCAAGLFALLVLILGAVALYARKPVIVPELLLLALAGLGLSVAARIQVQRSEGTRVGLKLATVAWWVSVLSGAGYAAYWQANELAIRQQAANFAEDWFKNIKEGRLGLAFLQTVEPARRQSASGDDRYGLEVQFGQGPLPLFEANEVVRLVERNGADLQAPEPLAVRDVTTQKDGFGVTMSFRLRCPEGVFRVVVPMIGVQGKELVGRQWFILVNRTGAEEARRTTYGRLVMELREEGADLARRWRDLLDTHQSGAAYRLTLPEDRRAAGERLETAWAALAGGAGELFAPPSLRPETLLAGDFFIDEKAKRSAEGKKLETFRQIWSRGRIAPVGAARGPLAERTPPQIRVTPDAIRVEVSVEIPLPELHQSMTAGRIVLICDDPYWVAEMQKQRQAGAANPDQMDDRQVRLLESAPPRRWRVAHLASSLEPLPQFTGPDGSTPGGPPGPGPGGPMPAGNPTP